MNKPVIVKPATVSNLIQAVNKLLAEAKSYEAKASECREMAAKLMIRGIPNCHISTEA